MNTAQEARYFAYASGNLGKNLLWTTADLTLLFVLTDLLGVPAATAGAIFFAGLLLDAMLDLVVGAAAQRFQGPLSHYGGYILLGAPACALAFIWLYSLPLLESVNLGIMLTAVLLFRALFAVIDVPHNALITMLADTSRARQRIAGYRFAFSSIATLSIATIIPALTTSAARDHMIFAAASIIAAVAAVTLWVAWIAVRSGSPPRHALLSRAPLRALVSAMLSNANLRRLVIIVFFTGLAPPLFSKGLIYYASYVLRDPRAAQVLLIGQAIGQLLAVPLWIWLGSRREKAFVLALSHGVAAAGFLMIWIVAPHAISAAMLGVLVGAGLCGVYMLPWAMAPDVVDEIDAQTGHRPDALLFAFLILAMKLGIGLSAAAFGGLLDVSGYTAQPDQPLAVRQMIGVFTCLVPALGCGLLIMLVAGYRLSHAAHSDVADAVRRRV